MPGLFITFEGIDGSGKSTQARRLVERLRAEGLDALHTREPGGSPGAEEIRRLVLEGDPARWSPITEILLFTAARRDHLERVIDPALNAGRVVVCDRFADSTRMYQGLRAGLLDQVNAIHEITIGREPDLTFVIDMDPMKGHARAKGRQGVEERFEDFGTDLQVLMRAGFLALAADHPERCVVIDGDRPVEAVAEDVFRIARARIG